MATTEEFLNGGSTSYPFSIEYIKASDIKVAIDGNVLTYTTNTNPASGQYKVVNTTVTLGATASAGSGNVHIYRTTDLDTAGATFSAGSAIRAQDLNACHDLVRLASQEQTQKVQERNIQDSSITSSKIKDGTIVDGDISNSAAIDYDKLDLTGKLKIEDLESGTLDSRYYTETESEALFLRQDSSETIKSGETWSGTDSKVATSAAIDARIIDLLDDVGGFVPVANETSFPTANPDINNGNGTVVSVKAVSTNLVPSSGTVTIPNGAGTGNTVTLTGVTETIPQGFGMILETTSTLHTYTFHRLQAKATEVNAVAANISNINAAIANQTNINAAVANEANINKAVNNEANINIVAGEIVYSEDLGQITNDLTTGTGNNIDTVANNISGVNTVANNMSAILAYNASGGGGGGNLNITDDSKVTGSLVYYDGTEYVADSTTTKSSIVIGGNF